MVGADDQAEEVRDDEADEADDACQRDAQSCQERREDEEHLLRPLDVYAQVERFLFPQAQGVQVETEEVGEDEPHHAGGERQLHEKPVRLSEGADDPEEDAVEVFETGNGHDQKHDGRAYEVDHDPDEQEARTLSTPLFELRARRKKIAHRAPAKPKRGIA